MIGFKWVVAISLVLNHPLPASWQGLKGTILKASKKKKFSLKERFQRICAPKEPLYHDCHISCEGAFPKNDGKRLYQQHSEIQTLICNEENHFTHYQKENE